jgi:hypothetical protein
MSIIRAQISPTILSKADRLFRNDDAGVFVELLQNARRAGASLVDIHIAELPGDAVGSIVTIRDNGGGIDDFQMLLTLGDSDWSADVCQTEDPAGMGFFSLCHSSVEVWSGNQQAVLSREAFLGTAEAQVQTVKERMPGTRIVFTRGSSVGTLVHAAKEVSEFYPLQVFVNGEEVVQHDFLEGSLYRETIDGIEVGFGTSFRWRFGYRDNNWNFHGSLIRESFEGISGVLRLDQFRKWQSETLQARFNVVEVGRVKLQLPDRRAIVQDQRLREFETKVRAAAYRFFATQDHHTLPFVRWKEAQSLGVELQEASPLLKTWHASPLDDGIDPFFGCFEEHLLPTVKDVLLVARNLPNEHTLEASLQTVSRLDRKLYQADSQYAGYSWYDALPTLSDAAVTVDGIPYDTWLEGVLPRPETILITATIKQSHLADILIDLQAIIHLVGGDDVDYGDEAPEFVAIRNSPWDNDDLNGPFDICSFLFDATFRSSDDIEADSWDTQKDYYEAHIQREVDEYFRGPKAALMGILQDSLSWEARRYAGQAGVDEIRFRRPGEGESGWKIEIVLSGNQPAPTNPN